jgi:hypothetical protein
MYKDINICTYIYVKEKSKRVNDGGGLLIICWFFFIFCFQFFVNFFLSYLLVNKIESKKVHLSNQKRALITVVQISNQKKYKNCITWYANQKSLHTESKTVYLQ